MNDFSFKDHVTEDWSNDTENSALITGIHYILQYIHIEINECMLGEQKRLLSIDELKQKWINMILS